MKLFIAYILGVLLVCWGGVALNEAMAAQMAESNARAVAALQRIKANREKVYFWNWQNGRFLKNGIGTDYRRDFISMDANFQNPMIGAGRHSLWASEGRATTPGWRVLRRSLANIPGRNPFADLLPVHQ